LSILNQLTYFNQKAFTFYLFTSPESYEKLKLQHENFHFPQTFCGYSKIISSLAKAVSKVATEVWSHKKTKNLIIAENSDNFIFADFKEELFAEFSQSLVVNRQYSFTNRAIRGQKENAIMIIHNFSNFIDLIGKITSQSHKLNGLFLFVLVNGRIPEIQEIFNLLWKKQLYNVNIIYKDNNSEILVETFIPFSPKSCNNTNHHQSISKWKICQRN
jgi:hypothetical protein